MTYGIIVSGNTYPTTINPLYILQKKKQCGLLLFLGLMNTQLHYLGY